MTTVEIQHLLYDYPSLKYDKERHKVICDLTKHEMPATVSAVESYVNGKRFKNASKKQIYNYERYKPHIVPSTKKKHLHELFCTLTLRHVGRTPEDVERHVVGKRYQKALARWQKCQETGEKFVPRTGGRPSRRAVASGGDDSSMKGDDSLSDHSDDDDMSDLYPATDFGITYQEGCDVENSSTVGNTLASGSDSDYDLAVLDEISTAKPETVASSLLPVENRGKKVKKCGKVNDIADNNT